MIVVGSDALRQNEGVADKVRGYWVWDVWDEAPPDDRLGNRAYFGRTGRFQAAHWSLAV